ncbi:MAG TPA: amidohydrolase family protein [Vicinamibacterales bacterium]|nr:amidohydrolase family protein [Vicinamibacterales bacterium]
MRIECHGFVDLQVNGFGGIDFNAPGLSADAIRAALAALRATGVTRVLPTLITGPLDQFRACARALAETVDPAVAGLHMEGPYISPEDGARGAHPREWTRPASVDDFARRQEAARGRIVLVTLAPEVPGAMDLIEQLVRDGVRVAVGHTEASPGAIRDAISAGASLATHLGNGCAAVLPRHPNVIWEQLASDALHMSLIVDGHHLPAATVKAMIRAKTPDRTILVSDAIAAAGCGPGAYHIGGVAVDVSDTGRASLAGTPYLAGSTLTMPEAVSLTVGFTGLPLECVLRMATSQPAAYLGIPTAGTVVADWDEAHRRLRVVDVR